MPRDKVIALQIPPTPVPPLAPAAVADAKLVLKVSLSLHFMNLCEPTHPCRVTRDGPGLVF